MPRLLVLQSLILVVAFTAVCGAQQPPAPPAEPPAPTASPAVQALLDAATKLAADNKPAEALAEADRALATAGEAKDVPGEARAQVMRGRLLETLRKPADALAAWDAAAGAWKAAGDRPGEIEALCRQALLLRDSAEVDARLTSAIERARGETARPRAAAGALSGGGLEFYNRGRLLETRRLWSESLAMFEKLAPGSLSLATSLSNQGVVLDDQGKPAEARNLHERALAIREKLAPGSLAVAASLTNLGSVFAEQGDWMKARDHHQRALAIRERLAPGSLLVAASLSNLGSAAKDSGDLAVAKDLLQRALAIQERLSPESSSVALSLHNLGSITADQGDPASAKAYLRRALAIQEKQSPGSLFVAAGLRTLGNIAYSQGELVEARGLYQRALEIQVKLSPGSLGTARTLGGLGSTAYSQLDLTGAREYYLRALSIQDKVAPDSVDTAAYLSNLGSVIAGQGDRAGARQCHLRALAIRERLGPGSPLVAHSLNNLGTLARGDGDLAGAAEYYQRALGILERLTPKSPEVATNLNNLAMTALDQGDLTRAKEYGERAHHMREELAPGSLAEAGSLNLLGVVAKREGNLAAAVRLLERAWKLVQGQAQQVMGDEARRAFGSGHAGFAANLQQALLAQHDRPGALRVLDEGRAQALQQVLAERGLERLADPESRKAHAAAVSAERIARATHRRALERERQAKTRLAQSEGKPEAERAPLQAALDAAAKDVELAHSALTRNRLETESSWARVMASAPGNAFAKPLPFAQARTALQPGELFLAYSVGEKETTLFVAASGNAPVETFTLAAGEKDLQEAVREIRLLMQDPSTAIRPVARSLTARLLPARAIQAVRGTRRVIVSPDGPLWNLPWSALVLPGAGRQSEQFLGLVKPLVFTQSLSLYARGLTAPRDPTPATLSALALGDPLFDPHQLAAALRKSAPAPPPAGDLAALRGPREILRGGEEGAWPALPATGPEAEAVTRLYGGKTLTGLGASEPELRRQMGSAKILHLATHGSYFAGDPLLSGLILTAPEPGKPVTPETDGVLEAAELLDPALKVRAEVVVLSACGTGRGKLERSGGLVGLTRCWQIAGARSVVASQWSVADASTGRLMTAFHQGLKAGLTKDEALRRAMAGLAAKKETAHPFYWAPFLLTGDPGALKEVKLSHPSR